MGQTRRGQRSPEARQRRYVNHYVRSKSVEDRDKQESINDLTPRQIREELQTKFGYAHVGVSQRFEKGEVLADGRGQGSLQKQGSDEDDE